MIFLDTSAIYALADRDDQYHQEALRLFQAALARDEGFVLHNYIIVESTALLQRRLGHKVATQFLQDANAFTTIWVDDELHEAARQRFDAPKSTAISFVDAMSFVVMTQHRITHFLGFDQHFAQEGFTLCLV
ncbi:MAG: type II toxin-antitoxin system VapC family toxin [Armatimonadota bacterium]